jgi:ribosomal protein S18 acetylase RimI-like enzyme
MASPPTIRRARPEDVAAIAAAARAVAMVPGLLASAPHEIHDEALLRAVVDLNQRDRGCFLVAEEGGELVGHGFLEPLGLASVAHVVRLTLVAHPGHQGRGVGRAVLQGLLDWARADVRVEKVELQVRSSNARAIALYRSLGFVEEGRKTRRIRLGPGEYLDDVYLAVWVGP